MHEFSFETDTNSVEPTPYENGNLSVDEFREIIGEPDRDECRPQQIARPKHGVITKLAEEIGFLFSDDGHGVVFSLSNTPGFDQLRVGQRVTFEVVRTEHGIVAENVSPITGA